MLMIGIAIYVFVFLTAFLMFLSIIMGDNAYPCRCGGTFRRTVGRILAPSIYRCHSCNTLMDEVQLKMDSLNRDGEVQYE